MPEIKPTGVVNKRQQVQYQYFPEEYFSGSDVSIHFGDVWNDEISSLQFILQENRLPIFGYASYTFDEVAVGSRIVSGSFVMPFKEAGYLYTILDHIAQQEAMARPEIAYLAVGKKGNDWTAPIKTRIEDALAKRATSEPSYREVADYHDWPVLRLNDTDDSVAKPVKRLHGLNYFGSVTEMQDCLMIYYSMGWGPASFDWTLPLTMQYDEAGRPLDGKEHISNDVTQLQNRLKDFPGLLDGFPLLVDGKFGPLTEAAVKRLQTYAGLLATGKVDADTKNVLESAFSANGTFDRSTMLAVSLFQRSKSLVIDGVVGEQTRKAMAHTTKVKVNTSKSSASNLLPEAKFANFEEQIWGRRELSDGVDDYNHRTYFYQGPNASKLKATGFDIYITYGPINEAVKANSNKWPQYVNFNTTVKAIRNIHLVSVQQMVNASEEPIYEVYQFMARDID